MHPAPGDLPYPIYRRTGRTEHKVPFRTLRRTKVRLFRLYTACRSASCRSVDKFSNNAGLTAVIEHVCEDMLFIVVVAHLDMT